MRDKNAKWILVAFGTGTLIGAGAVYLYHRMVSHLSQHLAALNMNISLIRDELEILKHMLGKRKPRHSGYHSMPLTSDEDDDIYEEAMGYEGEIEDNVIISNKSNSFHGNSFTSCSSVDRRADLFNRIDKLLDGNDVDKEEAYTLLQNKLSVYENDEEFLWRLAKGTYFKANMEGALGNEQTKKSLIYRARDFAYLALEKEDGSPNIHKWCGITLGSVGDYEGTQVKIENGYKFKQHIAKAISLNPEDPSLHYLLGRWCYGVYMLTWIERKIAATLFATPPSSTAQEALEHFLEADRLSTRKWKANLLYIAKCYIEMRDTKSAVSWLDKACRLPTNSQEDQESQTEINNLLGKYKR